MQIREYKKIMIVGNNGSGKSYFSKRLSAIINLPVIHLDMHFWKPDWQMPTKKEWRQKNIELTSKPEWIMDGNVNHGDTMEIRFASADLVIFLDVNRFVCFWSLIARCNKKRSDMPHYLDEKFDVGFARLIKGLLRFPHDRKKRIYTMHKKYTDTQFMVIKGRKLMHKFLEDCKRL